MTSTPLACRLLVRALAGKLCVASMRMSGTLCCWRKFLPSLDRCCVFANGGLSPTARHLKSTSRITHGVNWCYKAIRKPPTYIKRSALVRIRTNSSLNWHSHSLPISIAPATCSFYPKPPVPDSITVTSGVRPSRSTSKIRRESLGLTLSRFSEMLSWRCTKFNPLEAACSLSGGE